MVREARTVQPPIVQYQIALTHYNAIREQYDLDAVRTNHNEYRYMNRAQRSDHPELRESYLLCRKYSGFSRTVEEYEASHKRMCSNCHRVVHDEFTINISIFSC